TVYTSPLTTTGEPFWSFAPVDSRSRRCPDCESYTVRYPWTSTAYTSPFATTGGASTAAAPPVDVLHSWSPVALSYAATIPIPPTNSWSDVMAHRPVEASIA